MTALSFFCPGRPQTAGSKTAVPTKAGLRVLEAGTKESRARKKTWRGDLRDAAQLALSMQAGRPVLVKSPVFRDEPLYLMLAIVRRRPSAHLGTGRNAAVVKERYRPLLPVGRPDTVKMARAAEDALTGFLWADDSQIVQHSLYKVFADQAGLDPAAEGLYVHVTVRDRYVGPMIGEAA